MVNRKVNVAKRLSLTLAAALMACGGGAMTDPGASSSGSSGSSGSGSGGAAQSVAVEVTPPSANVYVQQSLGFNAAVTGTSVTGVTWSIQEGAAGGSVTTGGLYTAPTSPGTYHVVATSTADSGKSASATISVTTAPPVTGAPMTTASRTNGVAPLAVFFDGVDEVANSGTPNATFTSTSGVYQPPDMEGAQWSWNFGDPGSGTWSTTGLSRNTATGYTAAHVFENPGTYIVSLTVTDTAGVVRSYVQTITVTSFSGTTRYVAAGGTGDGTSTSSPWGSADTGLAWVAGGSNRRLLFNRGDTFAASPRGISGVAGPGIIGAYGTGAKPIINSSAGITGAAVSFSGASDWRIMDVDLRPASGPGTGWSGLGNTGNCKDILYLRVTASNWAVGLGSADQSDAPDGLAVVECENANTTPITSNGSGGIATYFSGRRLAILGNNIHDVYQGVNGSHVLRVVWGHHAVISNNRLWNPGCVGGYPTDCRHAIKLHGPFYNDGRPETIWVTINDNLIRGKTWPVAIGPSAGNEDERLSHIVYERNHHWGEATVSNDVKVWARHVMLRNNVFDATGAGGGYTAIDIGQRGVEPPPDDVRVYGNTVVRTDGFNGFFAVGLSPVNTNVVIRDNLVSSTSAPSGVIYNASGQYTQDHNWAGTLANALLSGDFRPMSGSPAFGTGVTLSEVREDFTRAQRSSPPDIGAY